MNGVRAAGLELARDYSQGNLTPIELDAVGISFQFLAQSRQAERFRQHLHLTHNRH